MMYGVASVFARVSSSIAKGWLVEARFPGPLVMIWMRPRVMTCGAATARVRACSSIVLVSPEDKCCRAVRVTMDSCSPWTMCSEVIAFARAHQRGSIARERTEVRLCQAPPAMMGTLALGMTGGPMHARARGCRSIARVFPEEARCRAHRVMMGIPLRVMISTVPIAFARAS